MGWAKYSEDNSELLQDRLYLQGFSNESFSSVLCTGTQKEVHYYFPSKESSVGGEDGEPQYTDKTLICCECGKEFVYSKSFQMKVNKRGWAPPKRCKSCRNDRKTKSIKHKQV